MALLSEDKRKEIFKALKLGEYNKAGIKALQSKYLARKSDADGIYGTNTDNLLRHLYNCHKYLNKDNFKPQEFKCECGGKYCSGYPTYMKPAQLTNLQAIRNKYKKPMTITSGMRCKGYNNAIGGSIANSKHLLGQATDFYMQGVTDTLANRKNFIKYAKGLPNTTYIYGNGINIYGNSVSAPYMGNAIHYDTNDGNPTPVKDEVKGTSNLAVDGIGGTDTVKRMQEFFGTTQDGVITGQVKAQAKYYPSLKAVSYAGAKSTCIKNLQKWVGTTQDGILGQATVKAWQKKLGVTADGIFGTNSMKAWQKYLNENDKPVYPPDPTPITKYKGIDVSEWQKNIDWAKVKADGVVCAIIRYADGDYLDPKFEYNMKNAKANGLHVGAYIFSRATNKAQAEKEATRLFNACNPYNCDMPLYIDLEAKGLEKCANTVANAFLDKIKALGGYGGVYANLNWWNNHLTKVNPPARWVAQYYKECSYKGSYGMWQYSSDGAVKGIVGRVDMNWCYTDYWNIIKPTPAPTPDKDGYQGAYPTYRMTKSNAKVKSDAVKWAKWIAGNNTFHYGYGTHSHHNGCYFCDTQPSSKKNSGMKEWKYTYCCNPFVTACLAHGGGDAQSYKKCANGSSWSYDKGKGYDASSLFNKLGHPAKSKLQVGDILCNYTHVAMYIGDGKIAEAAHEDDNKVNSKSWNDSIRIATLTDARWKKEFERAYRYNGSVDVNRAITHGEVSDRVADMQNYLDWYFEGKVGSADGIFGNDTLKWVKTFQEKELGKGEADGVVGKKTIEAMKKAGRTKTTTAI